MEISKLPVLLLKKQKKKRKEKSRFGCIFKVFELRSSEIGSSPASDFV